MVTINLSNDKIKKNVIQLLISKKYIDIMIKLKKIKDIQGLSFYDNNKNKKLWRLCIDNKYNNNNNNILIENFF